MVQVVGLEAKDKSRAQLERLQDTVGDDTEALRLLVEMARLLTRRSRRSEGGLQFG